MSFLRLLLAFALAMILLPDWPADAATTPVTTPAGETSSHAAWMFGLVSGIVITIAARVRWRDLPHRFAQWMRDQSRRAGWATLGLCYAWVLLFY